MSAFRSDDVYVSDRLAGKLIETDAGYEFAYHKNYLHALMHDRANIFA